MKALVGAFNQEKALVGAFSVIVQLHRLIALRHYLHSCGEAGLRGGRVVHARRGQPRARAQQHPRHVRGPGHVLGRVTGPRGGQVHVERGRGEQQT